MTDIRTVQEVASAILDIIPNHRRWMKEGYETNNGRRHCVVGAIQLLERNGVNVSRHDFDAHFSRIASSEYPERKCDANPIVDFNDHPDTRYSDVRRVLEKVAAG